MATKIKKKCVRSKATVKKGQGFVFHTVIKITLILVVLAVLTGVVAGQKEGLASINDWFMKILDGLGLIHLSNNDEIALASMQAMACAIDTVAYYSNMGNTYPEDNTIFDNIESCNVNLFEHSGDSVLGDMGDAYPPSGAPVVDPGDEEEELPVLTGVQKWTNVNAIVDGNTISEDNPKVLIDNYACPEGGPKYKIELIDIYSYGAQVLNIYKDGSRIEQGLAVDEGTSEQTGDISIKSTSVTFVTGSPSDSKVSGEVGCNS